MLLNDPVSVLQYLTQATDVGNIKATEALLIELSHQLPKNQGKVVMNMAERLKQSGLKSGLKQGFIKGVEKEKFTIARNDVS